VKDSREPATRFGVDSPENAIPPDEARLVAAAASGDSTAFEEIVRRHAGLVLSLGRRILGNREAAEDLLQDVFLKVHRALAGYRAEASLKTWIARIAVNAARNRKRDDARRLRVVAPVLDAPLGTADGSLLTLGDLASDDAPSPERAAASAEARIRIEHALGALPSEFREALVLREIEGLSYEEISEVLEISLGTVKSRIARARLRLMDALEDLAGGPA
jgi:RNA polymerase sigma-70 factor (ECF subfamily)